MTPGACAFVEQDGRIIDPATGLEAGIGAACVSRGVSIGYNEAAQRAAIADVRAFLADVFGTGP